MSYSDLVGTCFNRTVGHFLAKNNYVIHQYRNDWQLSPKHIGETLSFSKKYKQLSDRFLIGGISFYLDDTGFAYNTSPCKSI